MSGREGKFVPVVSLHALADPGRKSGARIAVLKCGHARTTTDSRTGKESAGGQPSRMWCHICTALQRAKKAAAKARQRLEVDADEARQRAAARAAPKPNVVLSLTPGEFSALMAAVKGLVATQPPPAEPTAPKPTPPAPRSTPFPGSVAPDAGGLS